MQNKKSENKSKSAVSAVPLGDDNPNVSRSLCSDLLTISEASVLLNLKISRLRNLIFYKRIPFLKIGSSIRLSQLALHAWIESQKVVG